MNEDDNFINSFTDPEAQRILARSKAEYYESQRLLAEATHFFPNDIEKQMKYVHSNRKVVLCYFKYPYNR